MRDSNNDSIKTILFIIGLMLFTITTFAQKRTPKIEKDSELTAALQGTFEEKGSVSYSIMTDILQEDEAKEVNFFVGVERIQQVIIEVFNEEGDLIEVLYNDDMSANKKKQFSISGQNWNKSMAYYLRVTTEDYIENHEIIFRNDVSKVF